jgi:ribosomal protein S18 acetylase RimI-like enzyme
VEPAVRNVGIGERLVDELLGFARDAGYQAVILNRDATMEAARRLCKRKGFTLADPVTRHRFASEFIGETWVRTL